jgi:hypothetical protein
MAFKVQKTENTGVVYAEPTDPDQTVRVKHAAQVKSLNNLQVTNQVTEVIVNDNYGVTIGDATAVDALSIRVRISGSLQATARKKALLMALLTTLDNWADEDVLSGFNPTTVPVSVT